MVAHREDENFAISKSNQINKEIHVTVSMKCPNYLIHLYLKLRNSYQLVSGSKKMVITNINQKYWIQKRLDTFSFTDSSLFKICGWFWEIPGAVSRSITICCFHSNWEVIMSIINRKATKMGLDILQGSLPQNLFKLKGKK